MAETPFSNLMMAWPPSEPDDGEVALSDRAFLQCQPYIGLAGTDPSDSPLVTVTADAAKLFDHT